MNLNNLKLAKDLLDYVVETRDLFGGKQVIFRFDNGHGAGLGKHEISNGLELGVLEFLDSGRYVLNYDTSVTDVLLTHIGRDEAIKTLYAIKNL